MPGKVNPVIAELLDQTCYHVIGNDLAVTMAVENGQLELNVMEPVLAFNLLSHQCHQHIHQPAPQGPEGQQGTVPEMGRQQCRYHHCPAPASGI